MTLKNRLKHVAGKDVGEIVLYALSTCQWCSKTKALLNGLKIEYRYVDVNLLDEADEEEVNKIFEKLHVNMVFPVIVINGKDCIVGYQEDKIRGLVR